MVATRGTLSTRGWLKTPESRLDRMMAEYVIANPAQTLTWAGRIRSLVSTVQQIGKDPDRLSSAVKSDLELKCKMCFPERDGGLVDVICQLDDTATEITLIITVTVYENGQPYSLNRILSQINSTFVDITKAVEAG